MLSRTQRPAAGHRGSAQWAENVVPTLPRPGSRANRRRNALPDRLGQHIQPKWCACPFPQAVRKSAVECKKNSLLILELLQKMVQRKISIKQVDGPIGIGSAVGSAAREKGWTAAPVRQRHHQPESRRLQPLAHPDSRRRRDPSSLHRRPDAEEKSACASKNGSTRPRSCSWCSSP